MARKEINAARTGIHTRNRSYKREIRSIIYETRAEMDRDFFAALNNRRYRAAIDSEDSKEIARASRRAANDSIIPKIESKFNRLKERLINYFDEAIPEILDREGKLFTDVYNSISADWARFTWNMTNEDIAAVKRTPIFGVSRQEWIRLAIEEAEGVIIRKIRSEMSGQINESDVKTVKENGMITRIMLQIDKSFNRLNQRIQVTFDNMSIDIMNYVEGLVLEWVWG